MKTLKIVNSALILICALVLILLFARMGQAAGLGMFYWLGIICGGVLALSAFADLLEREV
ncbi:hypothetical protein [Mongoliitalea daihaiensis]|uniref:hypothetical protein n=1 Tax=Mongoliitalea daihaiensis TaxID=2782006 RepID=UPI001F491C8E|nr:hypothetical protein [Mongoliitalea daihaiensis]UJP64021.1 hypothetical protein IPZ59_14495 [Mongoliitalea daihaiensis]